MNINILIIVCLFLCVAMFVYALLTGVQLVKLKVAEQEYMDAEGLMSSPFGPLINLFASFFNGELWTSKIDSLHEKLIKAGNPVNGIKANQFLGLLVLSAAGIFLFNLVSMTLIGGFSLFNLVFSLVAGAGAYIF